MTTIPKAAIDAAAKQIGGGSTFSAEERRYIAEAAIRAALPHMGEPVAWMREWNFRGMALEPEFTTSPELAEMFRSHPQTDTVIPLYVAPPAQAVKVKPLEWDKSDGYVATSTIGLYSIHPFRGKWEPVRDAMYMLPRVRGKIKAFNSADEARAFSEADYKRRVLAAIESVPTANCCCCGRIIDTREEAEGGDTFGAQLNDGRWTCSPECHDKVTG